MRGRYSAILLDLDGTLVDDTGHVPAGTRTALLAAERAGVRVVVATGRSELGAREVLDEELPLRDLAVVYNGAAVWCGRNRRLVEERVLSNRTVDRALELARREGLLAVAMRAGEKFALPPRGEVEAAAVAGLHGVRVCPDGELPRESLIRLTFFGQGNHLELEERLRAAIEHPVYLTSFPLAMLVDHRESPLSVVDLHAPCGGKAEALRVVQDAYGVPPERVVAVGDAMNDVPMLRAAGLAVAMERSTPDVLAVAGRVIGDNNTDAIGELVEELFGPL